VQQLACCRFASGDHPLKPCAFVYGEFDDIPLIHAFLLEFFCLTQGYDTVCQLLKWWWSDQ